MTDHHKTFQAPSKEEKEFAALSYLWVFSVLVYFSPQAKSEYVRHHAKQAVALFLLSIVFYFLPGYLAWLNVFVVFVMVLGVVESALGHWYILPLVGHWVQGKFYPQKHFSLIIHWFKKVGGVFNKKLAEKSFVAQESKQVQQVIEKEKRGLWHQNIRDTEKFIKGILSTQSVEVHDTDTGFDVYFEGAKVLSFGGVENDQFVLVYQKNLVFLAGDEEIQNWTLRYYKVDNLKKESLEALLKLMFEK